MSRVSRAWVVVAVIVGTMLFPSAGNAQIPVKGDISGVVVDRSDAVLPGVTVTLTGEKLFQRSLTSVSDAQGVFRFLNLTPGEYDLDFMLQGMSSVRMVGVIVDVGKTTPIKASMDLASVSEQVEVVSHAYAIEASRPQITVNYSAEFIEKLPTATRNYIDVMNASPGINDNTAYGTSGNISFSGFSTGSMTSAFRFNGVDVSDPAYGYSAISPIYETIESIQVAGIGASAEYGNFEGAAINVVTKSGTNTIHGSVTGFYSGNELYGDNSGGVYELRPNDYRYDVETTGTFGGPIVKEKLFYFGAVGYSDKKWKPYYAAEYQYNSFNRYQGKIDWVVNPSHTFNIMYNGNPAVQENFGFAAGQAPSTAQNYEQSMHTVFGSWRSVLNPRTLLDIRFAGYGNEIVAVPKFPGTPPYRDNGTGRSYGSGPFDRSIPAKRFEMDPTLTLGQREALGMMHDLKVGLEYENSSQGEDRVYSGGGSFNSLPLPTGGVQWTANEGGHLHNKSHIQRIALFVQDDTTIGQKLHINLGLRYERPDLTADKLSGSVATFNILSPRIGFTYDFNGDATNVLRASYGRYYNKVLGATYAPALPGNDDARVYRATLAASAFPTFNPNDANSLKEMFAFLTQPQYLIQTVRYSIPATVDPDLKLNGSDQFSIGFDRALGTNTSVSATYLYRKGLNRYHLESATASQHVYQEVTYIDPWIGNTVQLWQQLDRIPDIDLVLTNSSFEKTRTHMAMLVLRRRLARDVSIMASYTYQNTKSNLSGNGSSDLFGFPDYNVDTDPQYFQNPLAWGHQWDRPHQLKLSGNYLAPGKILIGANFRGLSSVPWHPQIGTSVTNQGQLNLPDGTGSTIYRSIGSPILLLDTRGVNRGPMTWNLDIRLAKIFNFGSSQSLEPQIDVLNAFNAGYYYNVNQTPYAVYPSTGAPAYGKPTRLFDPRSARLGLVWKF